MLQHGIDLHKRSLTIATVDEAGALVERKKLAARRGAVVQYFRSLEGPHRATVESTGSWYWIADLLAEQDVELKLAHAFLVKAVAAAKVKTDAVDALTLAQLLRADLLPEAHMISTELRPWRDLLRARLRLVERRRSAQNSVARLLEKYNVPGPEHLPSTARFQAQLHQEQDALLKKQIRQIERELVAVLRPDEDLQRLLWIPGIGLINALTLLLEIDSIDRFASEKKFFSYCRLVPGASNSGRRTHHKRSKSGNRYLKLAFSHAAIRAIQNYPDIKAFYQRTARKKPKAIARALVAKELARSVYRVLKTRTDFDGTFKGVPLSKLKPPTWPRRSGPSDPLATSEPCSEDPPTN